MKNISLLKFIIISFFFIIFISLYINSNEKKDKKKFNNNTLIMVKNNLKFEVTEDKLLFTLHYNKDLVARKAENQSIVGFCIHGNDNAINLTKELFGEYINMASNWKLRDTNSMFLRFVGDTSTNDKELFPGISFTDLEKLTESHGIIFWMQYPSILWISALDEDNFKNAYKNNNVLHSLIEQLAFNPYVEGSWFNVYGYNNINDFKEYNEFLKSTSCKRYETPISTKSFAGIYDLNSIDYSNPNLYLKPGPRSTLSNEYINYIKRDLGNITHNLTGVLKVMEWFNKNFSSGGIDEQRASVNDFFKLKKISGCTEAALVLATILRYLYFPAIYIITVDINAAKNTPIGKSISSGHQMVEVYVENKWILLDDFGRYTYNYDQTNPCIVRDYGDNKDYGFVIGKGLDTWDIGMIDDNDYLRMCTDFIKYLNKGNIDNYISNPGIYNMKRR